MLYGSGPDALEFGVIAGDFADGVGAGGVAQGGFAQDGRADFLDQFRVFGEWLLFAPGIVDGLVVHFGPGGGELALDAVEDDLAVRDAVDHFGEHGVRRRGDREFGDAIQVIALFLKGFEGDVLCPEAARPVWLSRLAAGAET